MKGTRSNPEARDPASPRRPTWMTLLRHRGRGAIAAAAKDATKRCWHRPAASSIRCCKTLSAHGFNSSSAFRPADARSAAPVETVPPSVDHFPAKVNEQFARRARERAEELWRWFGWTGKMT